jgi:hypothetical protein
MQEKPIVDFGTLNMKTKNTATHKSTHICKPLETTHMAKLAKECAFQLPFNEFHFFSSPSLKKLKHPIHNPITDCKFDNVTYTITNHLTRHCEEGHLLTAVLQKWRCSAS